MPNDFKESDFQELLENENFEDLNNVNLDSPEKIVELQVQRYVTGYTLYKTLISKINCPRCESLCKSSNVENHISTSFINAKNFSDSKLCLINPSDDVFEIFKTVMSCYISIFSVYAHKKGIKNIIKTFILNKNITWFSDEKCKEHRIQHLDFFLKVYLFKNSKWLSNKLISNIKLQRASKLKKL